MEKYRLNLQIGGMMQHVNFPNQDAAMTALEALHEARKTGLLVFSLTPPVLIDAGAVTFADVRKA